MAVNETIVTGRKFRKLTDAASKKWQRISFWHKASDCEFNDGKTAEEKLGAIKGITTDLNVTVPGYAADATRVSELNNSLGGLQFLQDAEGNWGYKPSGADTVIPFNLHTFHNLSVVKTNSNNGGVLSATYTFSSKGFYIGVSEGNASRWIKCSSENSKYLSVGYTEIIFGFAKASETVTITSNAINGRFDVNTHTFLEE